MMTRLWKNTVKPINRAVLLCRDIKVWEKWMRISFGKTTLNPETRRMKRVEDEDARLASSVTEILMGSDVPPRKAFIYEHAADARGYQYEPLSVEY